MTYRAPGNFTACAAVGLFRGHRDLADLFLIFENDPPRRNRLSNDGNRKERHHAKRHFHRLPDMVLLKSVLSGVAAAAIVLFAMALYAQGVQYRAALENTQSASAGLNAPVAIVVCTLAFAAGFWWQFRKAPK